MNDPIRPFVYRVKQALREDAGEYNRNHHVRLSVHTVTLSISEVEVACSWWYHPTDTAGNGEHYFTQLRLNGHVVDLTLREQRKLMTAGEAALARKAKRKQDEIQAEIAAAIAKLEAS